MHRTDFHAIIASMKNLIFDYDGTLHETMRIYGPAFRKNYENLVSRGLAPAREFSDAEISGWLGFTAADMWNRFAPQLSDEEKAACSRRIQDEMARLIENGTAELYPGVTELMDRFREEGYTILLLSNCKTGYLERHRKRFDLDRWFHGYYWSEGYGWKTKTEILKLLIKEHPGPSVMIGDRILDMKCAADCGIPSVGCAYGYAASPEEFASAACIAESPEDLPGIIRRILPPDIEQGLLL